MLRQYLRTNMPIFDEESDQECAPDPSKRTARRSEPTSSDLENTAETTWGEVFRTCCCHTPIAWAGILFKLFWAVFFLYFFILGLEILGDGAQVLTGCAAGALFGDDMNPISGLMIGILCTVFLQSSSTTTSIVVTLVGAGAISVNQGIYMVMGSNIGTSVTNTIVAMGQMGDGDQLERAFAGATVHDMFNFLTVLILFPLEVITGYLNYLTDLIIPNVSTSKGNKHTSFLKKIIAPVAESLIVVNKDVTESVAQGGSCEDFYPTVCEYPENPTKSTCSTIGLIGCPKDGDAPCPALFEADATYNDDLVAGLTAFLLGILVLFICLGGLVTVLQKLFLGGSQRVIYKATDINGYLAMLIGALITMAVQSSSIFTSTLTPLVGMDLIRLEQMFPMTLGSNIGTCMTSLLAAIVTEGTDALQVALAHLFFNVTGILIWYPCPLTRRLPLYLARQMGKATRLWKGFPLVYILVMFIGFPLALLGISSLFGRSRTLTTVGSVLVVVIVLASAGSVYWWNWRGGRKALGAVLERRQKNANARETLPYDLHYLRRRITELQQHTLCPAFPTTSISARQNWMARVSEDMDHALEKVELVARHTGLPLEEDTENLGRFWHKKTESMDDVDVDVSGWNGFGTKGIIRAIVGVVASGLLTWGLVLLFSNGSTGYSAMGGLVAAVLLLFVAHRFRSYVMEACTEAGKAKRLESYKDQKLREVYTKDYGVTMAQIKTDLETLESHATLEALTNQAFNDSNQ